MSTRSTPSFSAVFGDPLGPSAATQRGALAFTCFVIVVVLYDLGWRSLHNLDLPRFGVLAREMIRSGEWLVPTRYGEIYANKPPLMIWMIAAPAWLLGEVTPFLVRLPGALGLALFALSTAVWGRFRTGSVVVGRAAALLLLGTFLLTRLGRESRPDMLAAGLAAAGTVLLDALASGWGKPRHAVLAGALLGLGVLAKGPVVLFVPFLVLVLPSPGLSSGRRLRQVRPRLVGLGFATIVLAWLIPAWVHAGPGYAKELLLDQATTRVMGEANKLEPVYYYAARMIDAGAPWTPLYLLPLFLLAWRGGRRRLGRLQGLVVVALVVLVVFTLVPTKHVRYVVGVFPLLALAAAGVVRGWGVKHEAAAWWSRALHAQAPLLALLALAVLVGGWIVPGARFVVLPPAFVLIVLANLARRPRLGAPSDSERPVTARRRLVGTLLVVVVILMGVFWIFKDRYRVRETDAFNQRVAVLTEPGVPFLTLVGMTPDHVFTGAPSARAIWKPGEIPAPEVAPRLYVLLSVEAREAVEAARGAKGSVLLEADMKRDPRRVILLSFGHP